MTRTNTPTLREIPAVRALAESRANDLHRILFGRPTDGDRLAQWREAHLDLLCDLTRPASRDAIARLVAEKMGWPDGATAPALYWMVGQLGHCDSDGAPEGDGWPPGWWLQAADGHMHFFTGADWCPDDFTTVAGLPDGSEHGSTAIALIATHVLSERA